MKKKNLEMFYLQYFLKIKIASFNTTQIEIIVYIRSLCLEAKFNIKLIQVSGYIYTYSQIHSQCFFFIAL